MDKVAHGTCRWRCSKRPSGEAADRVLNDVEHEVFVATAADSTVQCKCVDGGNSSAGAPSRDVLASDTEGGGINGQAASTSGAEVFCPFGRPCTSPAGSTARSRPKETTIPGPTLMTAV